MATTDTLPPTHGITFPLLLSHLSSTLNHQEERNAKSANKTMPHRIKTNISSSDRQGRRRPFSTWVKKLTNFKNSVEGDRPKRHKIKRGPKKNNPYPESGNVGGTVPVRASACTFSTAQSDSNTSVAQTSGTSREDQGPPTVGRRSLVGTVSTDHEGSRSLAPSHGASSLAGTSRTVGGGVESRRGGDSTFSSPAPSVRSLTTTLTTIQSMAPNGPGQGQPNTSNPHHSNTQSIQFSQPFPTASPASAIPAHLAPSGTPTTYTSATANNLLTDNASILTLASSSKRRRRRSLDTDASVRALAPSSLWGGSRESLPLSVLSANIDPSGMPPTPGLHGSSSRMNAERTSIYSATGIMPAIPGDRSSFYAKQGDGASVRSGLLGHTRADSVSGSIGGLSSPLVSPREVLNEKLEKDKDKDKDKEKDEPLTPNTKEEMLKGDVLTEDTAAEETAKDK